MTEKKLSARYCPCCGEVTAVEKGKPSPWEPVTRRDIEDIAALRGQVATLRKAIQAALPVIHMVALHPLNKSNCPLGTYNQLVAALAATADPQDQEARHE